MGDVVKIKPPQAEKLNEPWSFRAACTLFDVRVFQNLLYFSVVVDLGFQICRQIDCLLAEVLVDNHDPRVVMFVENWAANGDPNPLELTTIKNILFWSVVLRRAELDPETLKVKSYESLADALVEQGLAKR